MAHVNDFDWAALADLLELEGETQGSYVRGAIGELAALPALTPRRILDIGSGPGVAACTFAAAFPQAEVVAVDGTAELLGRAEQRADRLGVRLRTRQAEFPGQLAELGSADLIWSGQAVHHVGDQQGALDQLAALLEPGGVLAVVEGGLPARTLPRDLGFGRPGLQERLDAAQAERFGRMRAELPGAVRLAEDWPAMLRAAGLTEAGSRTFLVELPAPLSDGPRRWVRGSLRRQREMLARASEWSKDLDWPERWITEDLATLDRLLDPADPAGVDRRTDLFLLTAKTLHYARRAVA